MISLKSIFTGKKKLSLIILLFLFIAPIYSASYSYSIVSENSEYEMMIEEVLSLMREVTNQDRIDEARVRLEREAEYKYEDSYDSYLRAENFSSLESLKKDDISFSTLILEKNSHSFSDSEKKWIFDSDEDAIDYYRRLYGIDMLIAVDSVSEDPVPFLVLSINGERRLTSLFQSLDKEDDLKELLDLFLPLLKNENTHLYSFSLPPQGTLVVDGKNINLYTGYIALENGEHTFTYSAPGYVLETEKICLDGTNGKLDLNLNRIIPEPLFITPIPYDAKLYYNGMEEESHIIKEAIYPFTLTLSHEGFSVYSLQSMNRANSLDLTMKPEWMNDATLLEDAKMEFYKSLFTTLMLFGGWVSTGVVMRVYPDVPLYPLRGVMMGVSVVSLVNLFQSMFVYYESAQLGL